jgi:hypothetical protein
MARAYTRPDLGTPGHMWAPCTRAQITFATRVRSVSGCSRDPGIPGPWVHPGPGYTRVPQLPDPARDAVGAPLRNSLAQVRVDG